MTIGRYGHASVVYKGRLIVAGGQQNSRLSTSVEAIDLSALHAYHDALLAQGAAGDGSSKTVTMGKVIPPEWEALPDLASPGRFAFSLLVINDQLYATGGGSGGGGGNISIERLDENKGEWVVESTLARCSDWGAVAVSYRSIIYLFGCYDPLENMEHASPHFNGYDVDRKRWLWAPSDKPQNSTMFSRMLSPPGSFEFNLPFPFQKFSCFVASCCDVTSVSVMASHQERGSGSGSREREKEREKERERERERRTVAL